MRTSFGFIHEKQIICVTSDLKIQMQCKIHIESTLARNPSDELNVQLGGILDCTLQKSPTMELNVTTPALIQLI